MAVHTACLFAQPVPDLVTGGGIMALDPGKRVGWAHNRECGSVDFANDDHGGMLAGFEEWLGHLLDVRCPAILVVEQAGFSRHVDALGITTLAMGRIAHMLAYKRGIARREAMPHQVRRWLLKGDVPKGERALDRAIAAALDELGLSLGDEHANDAVALALYQAAREAA